MILFNLYKLIIPGGSNPKSQRWLDAEAKLKKSAIGDIGPTIDKNTGYEVGTIFVDTRML